MLGTSGRTSIRLFLSAVVLVLTHVSPVDARIWGVKTAGGFSEPPSTLFHFEADGSDFTVVGPISLEGNPVDVDGLAIDTQGDLFAFVPGDASGLLVTIDPVTAVATGIGFVSGREIRGASFTSAGELIGIDIFTSELVRVDPTTGAQVGPPVPLTLDGSPFDVGNATDLAIHADGRALICANALDLLEVDLDTGVMTLVVNDNVLNPDGYLSFAAGIAFAQNPTDGRLIVFEVNAEDEILAYDLFPPFTRTGVYPDIVPGYNAGRGDLASFPGDVQSGTGDLHSSQVPFRDLTSFPNPFNPATTIRFVLDESTSVRLGIYDVSGNLVRVLLPGVALVQGPQEVRWNGLDGSGRPAPSGSYFVRIGAGNSFETRSMILLK